MPNEVDPRAVAARLAELRRIWEPEDEQSVRARMQSGRATTAARTFDEEVGLRLEELRALLELTAHLHRRRPTV